MKKFSNKSKKRYKKAKAIVKTVAKRYSIFVCLPILLYISYTVGLATIMIVLKLSGNIDGNMNEVKDFFGIFLLTCFGSLVCASIVCNIYFLVKLLKKIKSEPEMFKNDLKKEIAKQK